MHVVSYVHLLVLLCRTWTVKFFWEIGKVAILFRDFILLDIDKVPRWDEHFVIQRSVQFFITLFCVLGVVLQTNVDVYNCFTCIVSLYRNDPTPRKIDR
jgi:hypothetical protein